MSTVKGHTTNTGDRTGGKVSVACVCTLSSLYYRRHRNSQPPDRINRPVLLPSRQWLTLISLPVKKEQARTRRLGRTAPPVSTCTALDFCGGATAELEPLQLHIRIAHNTSSRASSTWLPSSTTLTVVLMHPWFRLICQVK